MNESYSYDIFGLHNYGFLVFITMIILNNHKKLIIIENFKISKNKTLTQN